jgi:hypothetical protein
VLLLRARFLITRRDRFFPKFRIIREPAVYAVSNVALNVRDDVCANSRTAWLSVAWRGDRVSPRFRFSIGCASGFRAYPPSERWVR